MSSWVLFGETVYKKLIHAEADKWLHRWICSKIDFYELQCFGELLVIFV